MREGRSLPGHWPLWACVVLTLVAYTQAPFGAFVWDDVHLILRDPRLGSWSNLPDIVTSSFWAGSPLNVNAFYGAIYRPVVSLAYLTQMQLFGENPLGYHLVNIALHVACVVLSIRWISRRVPSVSPLALFLSGIFFAIHPSRVESVAWISGSVDLWLVFWVLLALEAWDAKRSVLAGILLALALLSKEVAVVVPFLLLTDNLLLSRKPRSWKRWFIVSAIVAVGAAIRLWLVPLAGAGRSGWGEMPQRVLSTLGYFVQRVLLPWPQTVHPAPRSYDALGNELFASWSIVLGAFVLCLVSVLLVLGRNRAVRCRPWLADALWFIVPLLPTLNLLDIDAVSRASDRFLYLPLLGVCALVARAVTQTVRLRTRSRRAWIALAAVLSTVFALTSAIHVMHFRNDYTLWSHEYEVDQSNTEALWALAGMAKHKGLSESAHKLCTEGFHAADHRRYRWTSIRFALCQLETSVAVASPDDPETLVYVADVYDRLMDKSLLLAHRGSMNFDIHITSEAIRDRLMADPHQVALPRARAHLASGNADQAILQLEQITRSYPMAKGGWHMLIAAYEQKGDAQQADAIEANAERLFGPGWP